jgi:hypothetical protein
MIPLSLKKSQDLFGAKRGIAILRVPIRIGWELVEPTWLVVWNIWIIFHKLGIVTPTDELHHFSEG